MHISSNHVFVREVSSDLSSVVEVEKLIVIISEKFSLSKELQFKIQVSLIEAVNNAIIHGNLEGDKKTVIITCVELKSCLRFCIKDEGRGFDFTNDQLDPTCPERIEQPNGRGLFLMREFADQIRFLDRGRIIQMDFKHHDKY